MNIPRKALFGKLNTSLFRAMESATAYAKLKGHPYVELGHWLWHFWKLPGTDLQLLATHHHLDVAAIETELRRASQEQPVHPQGLIDFGHQIQASIEKAWTRASLVHSDRKIRSAWLLDALLSQSELRSALKSASPTLLSISPSIEREDWLQLLRHSVEHSDRAHDQTDLEAAVPGEASGALESLSAAQSALSKYCTDLTEQARAGKLDPVIGRSHEIRTMVDILLRRRQNNPLLTGEAGVGKTAVVEGLALAVAQAQVPPALASVRLLSLDVGALIAGASMRGEFESRLKQLLKEAQDCDQPVILFIDEIHTLVGAGGQAGTGDAANLLKPALARGGLRTIGATTWSEFKKHIEKDPALTRRFQVLQVHEPEPSVAKAMLRSLVYTFGQHHGVLISNEAVEAAVDLSHRYMPARHLPDKAISLLDTACARVAMSLHSEPAPLTQLRSHIHSVDTQLALCQVEKARTPEQALSIPKLRAQAEELQSQLSEQQARWDAEKALVQDLLSQWQALSDGSQSTPQSSQQMQTLRDRLLTLCWRRSNIDHLCRLNIDQGTWASGEAAGCG